MVLDWSPRVNEMMVLLMVLVLFVACRYPETPASHESLSVFLPGNRFLDRFIKLPVGIKWSTIHIHMKYLLFTPSPA